MYQFETNSCPSGFACVSRMITLLKIILVSSSFLLLSWYAISISWWAPTTSVACKPPSIQTTALPSAASAFASISFSPSALANFCEIDLYLSSSLWFSGEVMIIIHCERPSSVFPNSTSLALSDTAAIFFRYASVAV